MALALKAPGWAALSAGGIKRLDLPPIAKMVLIAADNDPKGTGQRAANYAAARWLAEGRRVKICMPPRPGVDWNDVLRAGRIDGRRDHAA
jgi:putative DNA primase/helicase